MKFHYQNTKHNPPESYGDCMRTCIACLIDRDPATVPNWFDPSQICEGYNSWAAMDEWLSDVGYVMAKIDVAGDLESLQKYMQSMNPGILYILAGDGHAIIMSGGKVLHDPSWLSLGVKEPSHMLFLLPIAMHYVGK